MTEGNPLAVVKFPTGLKTPVAGSNISADARGIPVIAPNPPTTRILPSANRVAPDEIRAVDMLPGVRVNRPVVGSQISAEVLGT